MSFIPQQERIAASHVSSFLGKDDVLHESGDYYAVLKKYSQFIALKLGGSWTYQGKELFTVYDEGSTIYRPIHPSVTLADVKGATYAIDDGTHWHFAHASHGEHHDLEALVEALLIAHFQPKINSAGAVVHAALDITARTLARNKLVALNTFVDAALAEVQKAVRALTLGQHGRETPHADNHRAIVAAAIQAVMADWGTRGKTDVSVKHALDRVSLDAAALLTKLTHTPTLETRAAKAARLAAAAKAKEMEGNGA